MKIKGKDIPIKGVSCDSKSVKPGFAFVAVKGARCDGNDFINEAIANGAKYIITDQNLKRTTHNAQRTTRFIKVKDARKALAELAVEFYGNPSSKIQVIGVTGTNGKTTITYLLEAALQKARLSPAVIGTVNYRFRNRVVASANTTPGPLELQSLLAEMLEAGVSHCLMEVSSHALDQQRVNGISFASAIFTNLTQDHLDYHKSIEDYFLAKAKLFQALGENSWALINNDSPYGRKLAKMTKAKVVTYGIEKKSALMARDLQAGIEGSEFSCWFNGKELGRFKSLLIGRHNVYNILGACACLLSQGLEFAQIRAALENFNSVPGRLERIACASGINIFVDYAHTEDALFNVISSLRSALDVRRRLIVVFGCGGERDKTKRPKMGKVVSELADLALITNDNPRGEDPLGIIEDIKRGINKDNYRVIPERREAISTSLSLAVPGDLVLVAGKGHESYQILGDKRADFDDRKVIKECLQSRKY